MPRSLAAILAIASVVLAVLVAPPAARPGAVPHRRTAGVAAAIRRIETSVDPCGETSTLLAVLERLDDCGYQIRTSATAERNLFDRNAITWNPELRSELEPSCDRDPTASLLHELVHAADACDGRNPGERELEAVRIENIYRRAAGLCQRTRYGNLPLPASMVKECTRERCTCVVPSVPDAPTVVRAPLGEGLAADSAPADAGAESVR
ncbi:MAG TPA: hypothetical protein VKU61_06820 [Candidatus Binatia bacterium]|nr:hypothetical protein [Candidatus Binatia bacterium]